MTNPTELLADRLEAGSALYDPQDRKLAVAALRAFASPPSDVGTAKIGRDSANRIMALRQSTLSPGQPSVVDFDDGEISVRINGNELRGWSYKDDAERRVKMLAAREYVEGYCEGMDAK